MSSRQVAILNDEDLSPGSRSEAIGTMELAARQVQFQALEKAAGFRRVFCVVNWRPGRKKTAKFMPIERWKHGWFKHDLNSFRNSDESLFHQETWGSYS